MTLGLEQLITCTARLTRPCIFWPYYATISQLCALLEHAGTDEITTLLEDVGLNLQSMLSSRYVQPFVEEVHPLGQ